MMSQNITIYGIKNCDKVRKSLAWMDNEGVSYNFHDYKKQGLDEGMLKQAISTYGWENVINKRGTTWKKLPDAIRESMDDAAALEQAKMNTSLVKRPILAVGDDMIIGFDENAWRDTLNVSKVA